MPNQPTNPPADALNGHGVVRGHVVIAVNILRARIAESWTLGSLASDHR
jgi:hypothetical protein